MPMSWISLQQRYGLSRPYDFRVAIPFLLNVMGLLLVLILCACLALRDELRLGTERFYFFTYIACLLAFAALLSRRPFLATVLLCWCIAEVSVAFGSELMERHGHATSLYPRDIVTPREDEDFVYHPLLQVVPRPNSKSTWQLGDGRQVTYVHNSLGARGKEPTAADLAKPLIFVYGGSTTYDVSLSEGDTWVQRLQAQLDDRYTLLNFGVIAHSTTEHLIATAFYQDVARKPPVCAIYYIGWNDIINARIANLDSAYADYHLLLTPVRKPDLALAKYSPLFGLLNAVAENRFDTIPKHREIVPTVPFSGSDERLEAIFREHVRTIAAINSTRGTRPIFIAQILNKAYVPDPHEGRDIWAPMLKRSDFVPLQARFNLVLQQTAMASSSRFIDPGIDNFQGSDFVDLGHFTAAGARKFARLIAEPIASYCQ
jgi:lysophospholipase L1-like esterase